MKSILTKMHVLSLLVTLPVLAGDVGLHNSSAQPTWVAANSNLNAIIKSGTLGFCRVSEAGIVRFQPTTEATQYIYDYRNQEMYFDGGFIKILKQPKHGEVHYEDSNVKLKDNPVPHFVYSSDDVYVGRDYFDLQVEKNGVKVNIHYVIQVLEKGERESNYMGTLCNPQQWKISQLSNSAEFGGLGFDSPRRLG